MKVSCNRCRKVWTVAHNFTTTSNYRKHYLKHHKDVPLKEENETELLGAASGSDEHTKENWEKTGSEGGLRKQLKEILVQLIVECSLSLSIVEAPAFHRLINFLDEHAPCFSRRTIRRELTVCFQAAKERVKHDLKKQRETGGCMSLTLDVWSSANRLDFLGITVHYLTSELEFVSKLLDFVPLQAQHTGKNQAEKLLQVLESYEITQHIFTTTTDNASCNDTLIEHLSRRLTVLATSIPDPAPPGTKHSPPISFSASTGHIRCTAHILNLGCQV
jgi:hypothetical protein